MLSLRRYDDPQIAPSVLGVLPKMTEDEQLAAFRMLAARPRWAVQLLAAIRRGEIDSRRVPSDLVQELRLLRDDEVVTAVREVFGGAESKDQAGFKQEIDRLLSIIAVQPGIPRNGRELFAQHCAKCHALFSKGGIAGPDLTTFPRHDLPNLLQHIVDPNAAIREGYLTSLVIMSDGRVLSGVMVDQDTKLVVLRGSDGKDLPLSREEIEEIEASKISLMPEGLLKDFSEDDVRDLVAYLRSSQPVIDQ
jgi:putative heme-binding domain-containing protein